MRAWFKGKRGASEAFDPAEGMQAARLQRSLSGAIPNRNAWQAPLRDDILWMSDGLSEGQWQLLQFNIFFSIVEHINYLKTKISYKLGIRLQY